MVFIHGKSLSLPQDLEIPRRVRQACEGIGLRFAFLALLGLVVEIQPSFHDEKILITGSFSYNKTKARREGGLNATVMKMQLLFRSRSGTRRELLFLLGLQKDYTLACPSLSWLKSVELGVQGLLSSDLSLFLPLFSSSFFILPHFGLAFKALAIQFMDNFGDNQEVDIAFSKEELPFPIEGTLVDEPLIDYVYLAEFDISTGRFFSPPLRNKAIFTFDIFLFLSSFDLNPCTHIFC